MQIQLSLSSIGINHNFTMFFSTLIFKYFSGSHPLLHSKWGVHLLPVSCFSILNQLLQIPPPLYLKNCGWKNTMKLISNPLFKHYLFLTFSTDMDEPFVSEIQIYGALSQSTCHTHHGLLSCSNTRWCRCPPTEKIQINNGISLHLFNSKTLITSKKYSKSKKWISF